MKDLIAPFSDPRRGLGLQPGPGLSDRLRRRSGWEGEVMGSRIRLILGLEAAIFLIAALIHFEVLFDGYPDREAGTAESIIGLVLLAGLIFVTLVPTRTRLVGLIVQVFALVGTLVGLALLFLIGPMTSLDVVIHLVMVAILIIGLMITWNSRAPFHQRLDRVSDHESRR